MEARRWEGLPQGIRATALGPTGAEAAHRGGSPAARRGGSPALGAAERPRDDIATDGARRDGLATAG
jgi:hypothetical protein